LNARDNILKAADKLFGEHGFEAATTREIAEKSGVNKALIHYHFKSKDALFEAVMDSYYQRLNNVLISAIQKEEDPKQKLLSMLDVYVDFLAKNKNFSRIVQRESAGGHHIERVRQHLEPMFELGIKLVHETWPGTKKGPMSAEHLLVSFYGVIVTYFTYSDIIGKLTDKNPLSKKSLDERKEHLHRLLDILLNEVGG
jgi:AcrR family transcriptional regulator